MSSRPGHRIAVGGGGQTTVALYDWPSVLEVLELLAKTSSSSVHGVVRLGLPGDVRDNGFIIEDNRRQQRDNGWNVNVMSVFI